MSNPAALNTNFSGGVAASRNSQIQAITQEEGWATVEQLRSESRGNVADLKGVSPITVPELTRPQPNISTPPSAPLPSSFVRTTVSDGGVAKNLSSRVPGGSANANITAGVRFGDTTLFTQTLAPIDGARPGGFPGAGNLRDATVRFGVEQTISPNLKASIFIQPVTGGRSTATATVRPSITYKSDDGKLGASLGVDMRSGVSPTVRADVNTKLSSTWSADALVRLGPTTRVEAGVQAKFTPNTTGELRVISLGNRTFIQAGAEFLERGVFNTALGGTASIGVGSEGDRSVLTAYARADSTDKAVKGVTLYAAISATTASGKTNATSMSSVSGTVGAGVIVGEVLGGKLSVGGELNYQTFQSVSNNRTDAWVTPVIKLQIPGSDNMAITGNLGADGQPMVRLERSF